MTLHKCIACFCSQKNISIKFCYVTLTNVDYYLENTVQSNFVSSAGKTRLPNWNMQAMLIFFFDPKGIIHKEFFSLNKKVTQFQLKVLQRLCKRLFRVQSEIATSWILHHDNAPMHTALEVKELLLNSKSIATMYLIPLICHRMTFTCFSSQKRYERSIF